MDTDFERCLAFSPDNKTLASSWDLSDQARLWTTDGNLLQTLGGHNDEVRCVAFSPDGSLVISGSTTGAIRLWEAATGHLLSILTGHTASVAAVAISPDNRMLASIGDDATVRLWIVQLARGSDAREQQLSSRSDTSPNADPASNH